MASKTTTLIRTLDLKTLPIRRQKNVYPVELGGVGFSSEVWIIESCLNLSGFFRPDSCGLPSSATSCPYVPLLLASSASAGDSWVPASKTCLHFHCCGCPSEFGILFPWYFALFKRQSWVLGEEKNVNGNQKTLCFCNKSVMNI